jgi:Arc/MetJ family transcription regulator
MMSVSRTTVDIDQQALDAARHELGTKGLSATVNAALREVGRRRALASFDVTRDIDGTPAEVEANRRERLPELGEH